MAVSTLLDWYLTKTKNRTVFKGTVVASLAFIPFFAMRVQYNYFEMPLIEWESPACLMGYQRFSKGMVGQCLQVSRNSMYQLLCMVVLKISVIFFVLNFR